MNRVIHVEEISEHERKSVNTENEPLTHSHQAKLTPCTDDSTHSETNLSNVADEDNCSEKISTIGSFRIVTKSTEKGMGTIFEGGEGTPNSDNIGSNDTDEDSFSEIPMIGSFMMSKDSTKMGTTTIFEEDQGTPNADNSNLTSTRVNTRPEQTPDNLGNIECEGKATTDNDEESRTSRNYEAVSNMVRVGVISDQARGYERRCKQKVSSHGDGTDPPPGDQEDVSIADRNSCNDELVDSDRNTNRRLSFALSRPGAVRVEGIEPHLNTGWVSTHLGWISQFVLNTVDRQSDVVHARALSSSELYAEFNNSDHVEFQTDEAQIIGNESELQQRKRRHHMQWACLVLVLMFSIVGLTLGYVLKNDTASTSEDTRSMTPSAAPTSMSSVIPTITAITNRGKLLCGVGWMFELEADLCRILAAALFGNSESVEILNLSWPERWEALHNGTVDVVNLLSTITMDRDVHQKVTQVGYSFSDPVLYEGIAFGGIPPYGECAANINAMFDECIGVRLCVSEGSSTYDFVSDIFPDFNIRQVPFEELYKGLSDGRCNAIVEGIIDVSETMVREKGYTGPYEVGKRPIGKNPLSLVMCDTDQQWVDFVNFVLRALLTAEQQGITNVTAKKFYTTTLFGQQFENMFIDAIGTYGNYGQIYAKHLERFFPRSGLNSINTGNTGLIYSYPFGAIEIEASDPEEGSMLHTIRERGVLRCGIPQRILSTRDIVLQKLDNTTTISMGDQNWKGMDADYCYALAASLFDGDDINNNTVVEFVPFARKENPFVLLHHDKVDVLVGIPVDAESDVLEPKTGKGYTFSVPYLYITKYATPTTTYDEAISLVTRQDDAQWSAFVYWIVSATFFADEKEITSAEFSYDFGTPLVNLFGPSYQKMLRHAIRRVGNYNEIYTRNMKYASSPPSSVGIRTPRQGRNLVNRSPQGPQQLPFSYNSISKFERHTKEEAQQRQQEHTYMSRSIGHLRKE